MIQVSVTIECEHCYEETVEVVDLDGSLDIAEVIESNKGIKLSLAEANELNEFLKSKGWA
jgi:hypothetical protein